MSASFHNGTGSRNKCGVGGFTLLEMTIVLAIIGMVATGSVLYLSKSLQQRSSTETQYKLQVLQQTLLNYRLTYNRLPCPAGLKVDINTQAFGTEVGTPGDGNCTGADFTGGSDVEGMVPTKALGLADDFAFDGWGRRIDYAIDTRFTATNAFSTILANDATARMTVEDASDTNKTTLAAYVLVSFGPDGHGAFPRGASASPINTGASNTDELQNCDCDSSANATGLNGVFVQKDATQNPADLSNVFDDVVVYATRSDLRSAFE